MLHSNKALMFTPLLPNMHTVLQCPATLIDQGVVSQTVIALQKGSLMLSQLVAAGCTPF